MTAARAAVLALLLALVGIADASSLRRAAPASLSLEAATAAAAPAAVEDDVNKTVVEIKAKWKKLDEVMGTMFKLACTWKHGKDIDELTLEKLKDRSVKPEDTLAYKQKLQAANVKAMEEGCKGSKIEGETKCRKSCLERHESTKDKADCDKACVAAYDKFEKGCYEKAKGLAKVYAVKMSGMNMSQQCHEKHCKEFPTVWTKGSPADMKTEVEAQCASRCTEAKISEKCATQWDLKVDGLSAGFKATCFEKSGVKACFDKKKEEVSKTADSCKADGKAKCEADSEDCLKKLGDSQKDVCQERKRTCDGEATKGCQDALQKGLEQASKSCEQEGAAATDKCVKETSEQKKKEDVAACVKESTTRCPKECGLKCETESLAACLTEKAKQPDLSEDFCAELWKMVRDTSTVDPTTGNPIVLLSGTSQTWQDIFSEEEEKEEAEGPSRNG